jgi:polyhydroxyalkanoate synthesis regulator phasin
VYDGSNDLEEHLMSATSDLAALERELEQLKQQLPRHSISPSIQARIDELEEQIDALKNAAREDTAKNG